MKKIERHHFVNGLWTLIVTCGGLGFFPKGSGTVASFFALGFWSYLRVLGISWVGLTSWIVAITVVGTFAIHQYQQRKRVKDASEIVIDEWVGMGISMAVIPFEPLWIAGAFFLFRLFDIWKPWGVRFFDRQNWYGIGVMADDVVAGVYVLALLKGVQWWIG